MAILYGYSCDLHGTSYTDLQQAGWALGSTTQVVPGTTSGRFGGGGIYLKGTSSQGFITRSVSINASTIIVALAFKHEHLANATAEPFITLYNNGGADQVAELKLNPDGSLTLENSASTDVITSSGVVSENVWTHVQFKVKSHASLGTADVLINNVSVISETGLDTSISATDIDKVRISAACDTSSYGTYVDDIVFIDDNNADGLGYTDCMGDMKWTVYLPTADTATTDWTRSSGSNDYEMIDDTTPGDHDGDSTYLSDATAGHVSLFDFADITSTPATIYAVQASVAVKKSDAGDRTVRAYLVSNGNTSNGTTWSPSTDYETLSYLWEADPDGAAAWIKAKVNAAQLGIELVS